MVDCYFSAIAKVDQDMATKLNQIPYFNKIEIKNVEVFEDVFYVSPVTGDRTRWVTSQR
jgi:hypothetical protein